MSSIDLSTAAPVPALVSVDQREYPLESARIVSRAEGGLALTSLVQRFANPYDDALEVIYTMPLPADGAVTGYTVRIGERVIRSEVQPREKADEAYQRALFEGRTAGLLSQSRADTFEQKLGNIPARTAVEVTVDVLHPLGFVTAEPGAKENAARDAGPWWEFRFPTVVGVRYQGAAGRVRDAADLSPDRGRDGEIPTRVSLELTLADGPDAARASSPSHALAVVSSPTGGTVSFREGERLDRDVVVRWPAATATVGARIVEGAGLEGDDGRYALVTLTPPAVPDHVYHRDLTLLVDASGSMSGPPITLAKRVGSALLESLGGRDRFEIIAFSNQPQRLTRGFVSATPASIAQGIGMLEALQARGGTEMLEAVAEAMKSARGDAQRQVVLITDGEIGFEQEVVTKLADQANVRLHAVGVGPAVNRTLTQRAALAGRGIEVLVASDADAALASAQLVAATAQPLLTGLRISGTALAGPQRTRVHDVFAGRPLVFTVELSPKGGALAIEGSLAGKAWSHALQIAASLATGAAAPPRTPIPIGALHGQSLVTEYEVFFASDDRAARETLIERCAMRHRIPSSRTSLVAIAEEPAVDPRAPRRRVKLPVELPRGLSAEGLGFETAKWIGFADGRFMKLGRLSVAAAAPGRDARKGVFDYEASMPRGIPRAPEVEGEGHWLDAESLVLEFRVRYDEAFAIGDEVWLEIEAGTHRLPIDWSHSSPRGPFRIGQIVRLAVRVPHQLGDIGPGACRFGALWKSAPMGTQGSRVDAWLKVPKRPAQASSPR